MCQAHGADKAEDDVVLIEEIAVILLALGVL